MSRWKMKWNAKSIAMMGVLVALHIVANRMLAINLSPSLRFSCSSSFVMPAGIWFGPAGGMIAGAPADLPGCVIGGYPPFLPLTVTPVLIGLLSGLAAPMLKKSKNILIYGGAVAVITLFASVLYGTWAQTLLRGMPFWSVGGRAVQGVCTTIVNTLVVYALYRSPVTNMIER